MTGQTLTRRLRRAGEAFLDALVAWFEAFSVALKGAAEAAEGREYALGYSDGYTAATHDLDHIINGTEETR